MSRKILLKIVSNLTIQGLYGTVDSEGSFYRLLAKVMLSKHSRKGSLDGGKILELSKRREQQ